MVAPKPLDLVAQPNPTSGLLSDAIKSTQQVAGNTTASAVKNASAATATTALVLLTQSFSQHW